MRIVVVVCIAIKTKAKLKRISVLACYNVKCRWLNRQKKNKRKQNSNKWLEFCKKFLPINFNQISRSLHTKNRKNLTTLTTKCVCLCSKTGVQKGQNKNYISSFECELTSKIGDWIKTNEHTKFSQIESLKFWNKMLM